MYTCKQKILTVKNKLFTSKNITIHTTAYAKYYAKLQPCLSCKDGADGFGYSFFFWGGGDEMCPPPPFNIGAG